MMYIISLFKVKNLFHCLIDGMDQNKTNIPCLTKLAKSTQSLWRLRTHLTGVLVHTKCERGKKTFCYFDILQYPHDANLVLSILLEILNEHPDRLPPILFLQMDNYYHENKNRYVFAFLLSFGEEAVVQRGI